jgi:hypothetical protein
MTPLDFARAILHRFNIPETQNRLIGLVAFAGIEGGHWAPSLRGSHNPFNTTLRMTGSRSITSVGVQAYPDWSTGVEATARTMAQSNMHTIMDALRTDASPKAFLHAITQSAWCPGCNYDPFDPYALYSANANKDDGEGGSSLAKPMPWSTIALVGGLLAAGGLGAFYLRNGRLPRLPRLF